MSPCPGLIPCTPTPSPAPLGLTHAEVMTMGTAYGTLIGVFLLAMAFLFLVVIPSLIVLIATRR